MEFFFVVLGLAYLVLPFFGFVAWWRNREHREELERLRGKIEDLRTELHELRQPGKPAPQPVVPMTAVPVSNPSPSLTFRAEPEPAPELSPAPTMLRVLPPAWDEEPPAAPPPIPEAPAEPPVPPPTAEPYDWAGLLRRLHLLPPEKEWTEAGLAGWWTTRVGILLGIIAAVFFAVYVSHQSPAWVRWLELLAVALGLSFWGWRLTRPRDGKGETTRAYGEVVLGGGLALLFFSSFAAYALAPVRIVSDPRAGVLLQVAAALGFFALAWVARLRVAGTFSILGGIIALGFAQYHGFHGFALLASVLLAAAGPGLLLGRGWILPALVSLVGTLVLGASLVLSGRVESQLLFGTWLAVVWWIHVAAPWRGHARGNWPLDRKLDRFWTTANTSGIIALAWLFSHETGGTFWKPFTLVAAITALVSAYALRRRMPDPYFEGNYYLKGSFLFTAWLLLTLEGPARWVSLGLQAAALLASWWREPRRVHEVAFIAVWLGAWLWAAVALIFATGDAVMAAWPGEAARHVFLATALATSALYHRKKSSAEPAGSGTGWTAVGVVLTGVLAAASASCYLQGEVGLAFAVFTLAALGVTACLVRTPMAWVAPALVLLAATVRFFFGGFRVPFAHPGELGLIYAGLWGLGAAVLVRRPLSGLTSGLRFVLLGVVLMVAFFCGWSGTLRAFRPETAPPYPEVLVAAWGVLAAAAAFLFGFADPENRRRGISWVAFLLALGSCLMLVWASAGFNVAWIALGWMGLVGVLATVSGTREPRTQWWVWGVVALVGLHVALLQKADAPPFSSGLLAGLLTVLWALGAWRMRPLGGTERSAGVAWVMAGISIVCLGFQNLPTPLAFIASVLLAAGLAFASGRESLRELRGLWPVLGWAGWIHLAVFRMLPEPPQNAVLWWIAAVAALVLTLVEARTRRASDPVGLRWSNQSATAISAVLLWIYCASLVRVELWNPAVLVLGALLLAVAARAFRSVPAGVLAVLLWMLAAVRSCFLIPDDAALLSYWSAVVAVVAAGWVQGWVLHPSWPDWMRKPSDWGHALASAALLMFLAIRPESGLDAYATVLWAAAGSAVLASGFAARLKPYRLAGLGILALAIVRLFLHDLDSTFHRIIASAALAVLLVAIGFFYNRFRRWLE